MITIIIYFFLSMISAQLMYVIPDKKIKGLQALYAEISVFCTFTACAAENKIYPLDIVAAPCTAAFLCLLNIEDIEILYASAGITLEMCMIVCVCVVTFRIL